ncbi:MAG: hypothetical protein ACTSUN_03140 [Promethearchaeota archaeon]
MTEKEKKISSMIKIAAFLGISIGILAAFLQCLIISAGGPEAHGFCVVCHARDLISSTFNSQEFLYFTNINVNIQALLIAENLYQHIKSIIESSPPNNNCIEYQLGSKIRGGISKDGKDIVEIPLNIYEGNEILKSLKKKSINHSHYIQLF